MDPVQATASHALLHRARTQPERAELRNGRDGVLESSQLRNRRIQVTSGRKANLGFAFCP